MSDPARMLWARSIVRSNWRSTVFLTLFAAIAASASMTAWQYSRRAETVIDRRVEQVSPADGTLNTCPPGADPSVDITPCFATESNEFAYGTLAKSPYVSATLMVKSAMVTVAATPDGEPSTMFVTAPAHRSGSIGVRNLIAGRQYDEQAADEILISEATARGVGVSPGSTVWVSVCDFGIAAEPACGERKPMKVVGVTRTDSDLLPARPSAPGLEADGSQFGGFVTANWYETRAAGVAGFSQTTFRLAPATTLDDVRADMQRRLPEGWTLLVTPNEDLTTYDGLRQSTQLQARALLAIAVILVIAGAVFVGQALVRQIRRELADHSVAAALGMTTGDIMRVAIVRALIIASSTAAIAIIATVIASGFGPSGLAGRAEVRPGAHLDAWVVLVGGVSIVAFVLLVVAVAARRVQRVGRHRPVRAWPTVISGTMSPSAKAGMALGRSARSGGSVRTAVFGTAAALIGLTMAAVLVDSLHQVPRDPRSYGVSWQYSSYGFGDASPAELLDRVRDDPLLTDVGVIASAGPIELPSVPAFWVVSFTTVKGSLDPVIVEGRAPIADDEVAVAPATLRALGKHIGDTIESLPVLATGAAATSSNGGTIGPFDIVGVVLLSDNDRVIGPGKGMLLTEAARQLVDPAVSPVLVVRTDPARSPIDTAVQLQRDYGNVAVPNPQADLTNLLLISNTPWVIALLVAALAVAALGHALVSLVRRSKADIGVLRALGFTRGQIGRAVCWQATLLAAIAVIVGAPVGVVAGRWGWRVLADRIGLVDPPVVHAVVPALGAACLLVLANAIALWPGMRAGRQNVVESLRAE